MFVKEHVLVLVLALFASCLYEIFKDSDLRGPILELDFNKFYSICYNRIFNLYTADQLKKFDGANGGPIYLSILGSVFDVSEGKKFYGESETYHCFAGRDASKSFITGDFSPEGLTDDIVGLELQDLLSLVTWRDHYHNEYKYKGKLVGRYYDSNGYPTDYMETFEKNLLEAKKAKENEAQKKIKFPPCNYEWSESEGTSVWCSPRSGGVVRDWSGVPRQMYQPGSLELKCVCIQPESREAKFGSFLVYNKCSPTSDRCKVVD